MAQEPKRAPHLLSHQEDRLWKWVGRYVQPRVDRRKHGRIWEQSYDPIVLRKVENRRAPGKGRPRHPLEGRGKQAYESVERKHNETQNSNLYVHRSDIDRIAELAKEDPKRQFFFIAHLITVEKMCEAFRSLRKDASAGIDGVTYEQYEVNVEENIWQLHQRLKDSK